MHYIEWIFSGVGIYILSKSAPPFCRYIWEKVRPPKLIISSIEGGLGFFELSLEMNSYTPSRIYFSRNDEIFTLGLDDATSFDDTINHKRVLDCIAKSITDNFSSGGTKDYDSKYNMGHPKFDPRRVRRYVNFPKAEELKCKTKIKLMPIYLGEPIPGNSDLRNMILVFRLRSSWFWGRLPIYHTLKINTAPQVIGSNQNDTYR